MKRRKTPARSRLSRKPDSAPRPTRSEGRLLAPTILPPSGEYFTASVSGLVITCISRSASAETSGRLGSSRTLSQVLAHRDSLRSLRDRSIEVFRRQVERQRFAAQDAKRRIEQRAHARVGIDDVQVEPDASQAGWRVADHLIEQQRPAPQILPFGAVNS